ncbi:MAG: CPBP family intramembrane metalloprotease [Gemmatimonadetes bacterium]|nr:CPBP family intramembrane metalloprotease [Gemmatimonadota bacterium]
MTPAVARVAVGALLACAVWARAGWSSWNQMGWPGPKAGFAGFGLGLGVGLGMAAAAVVLELLVGQARLTVTPVSASAYLAASAPVAGMLAIAALAEELLFRGFPLSHLARALGPVRAALALAIGFAALHAFNPGVTPLGLINIGVASLALSAIFFRLGGLPAAWGAHLGWNGGLALGADAPVSGIAFHLPAVDYSAAGPNWITGGSFGPEGGLVATTVMGAVAVWLGKGISKATGG